MAEGSLNLDAIAGLRSINQQPNSQAKIQLPEKPKLAPNVQLIGEMTESAFKHPQWLISRDGRYVQVSELVYRVAEQATGEYGIEEMAKRASEGYEREISPGDVADMVARSLIPTGLVAQADGTVVPQASSGPSALQVNMKMKMFAPGLINAATSILKVFHYPPVLVSFLVLSLLSQYWLFFVHGIGSGLHDSFNTPGLLAALLGILFASAMFHEFGHASALTYGGGKVGGMGAGVYIVYPALYTDVTDNYRLPRWSRIRTDLGGFYFNLIFNVGLVGAYFLTGEEFLLIGVVATNLEIIHQLLPFVRLDGYWALADLTGIPDFFSQIGPYLRSVLPRWVPFPEGRQLPPLKSWARLFFAGYILVTIPLLVGLLFLLFRALPRIIATAASAFGDQAATLRNLVQSADVLMLVATVVQLILLALPAVATVLLFVKLFRKMITSLWHWSEGSLPKRATSSAAVLGVTGLFAFLWLPQMNLGGLSTPEGPGYTAARSNWTPIEPGERLTVQDAARSEVVVPAVLPLDGGADDDSGTPTETATPGGSPTPTTATPPSGTPAPAVATSTGATPVRGATTATPVPTRAGSTSTPAPTSTAEAN